MSHKILTICLAGAIQRMECNVAHPQPELGDSKEAEVLELAYFIDPQTGTGSSTAPKSAQVSMNSPDNGHGQFHCDSFTGHWC